MRTTMKMMKRTKMAMARWLLGLCGLLCAQALEAQNLDSLLRAVRDRDQAVRMEVIRLSQQVPPQVDSLLAASARMEEVDAANRRIVSDLLAEGWPEGLSDEANEAIWLVIDHADLAMQRRWMPLVDCLRNVENGALNSCIFPEELRMVQATVEKANAT